MNPKMLTSFVDGSKAMIEMASLANTTGLGVSKRGMHGPAVDRADAAPDVRAEGGRRDPRPPRRRRLLHRSGGTRRLRRRTHRDPYVHHEMTYLQMGDGPYFALYRPYHLASLEAPLTVYEMVLDRAAACHRALDRRGRCPGQAALKAGEKIDGIGGSMVRGISTTPTTSRAAASCRSASSGMRC